jgi:2-oxoglutarate ferredoxin oxidoreductase subunit alpha
MFDHAVLAFDLAEKYRTPVMILSDGIIGQMMEPAEIDKPVIKNNYDKSWILDGCKGRAPRSVKSLLMGEGDLEKHNNTLEVKFNKITASETRFEAYDIEDADIILVAFGVSARVAKAAAKRARLKGVKAGCIRPITLWPFPEKVISDIARIGKKFLVVEMNLGQMVEDVRLAVNGKCPVHFHGKAGGVTVNEDEVLEEIMKL